MCFSRVEFSVTASKHSIWSAQISGRDGRSMVKRSGHKECVRGPRAIGCVPSMPLRRLSRHHTARRSQQKFVGCVRRGNSHPLPLRPLHNDELWPRVRVPLAAAVRRRLGSTESIWCKQLRLSGRMRST